MAAEAKAKGRSPKAAGLMNAEPLPSCPTRVGGTPLQSKISGLPTAEDGAKAWDMCNRNLPPNGPQKTLPPLEGLQLSKEISKVLVYGREYNKYNSFQGCLVGTSISVPSERPRTYTDTINTRAYVSRPWQQFSR